MYNKKSKASAILVIVTALLLVGFMVMLRFLQYDVAEDDGLGVGIAVIVIVIFGYPPLYVCSSIFAIVAVVFGIRMLKQQSRKKLISFNVRMLITTCVLLPLFAVALSITGAMIFQSTMGIWPIVYTIIAASTYIIGLITQIVTIILLKKSPEEGEPTTTEQ